MSGSGNPLRIKKNKNIYKTIKNKIKKEFQGVNSRA
jgi:hypothetical protein